VSEDMGNTRGLPTNNEVALIQRRDEHRVKVDRPHAIVGFFQTDVLVDERVRDIEQPLLKAKGPGVGHALHQIVSWILMDGRLGWVRPRCGTVPTRRRLLPERFVRSLRGVLESKRVETR
jgi:hypothetical protein